MPPTATTRPSARLGQRELGGRARRAAPRPARATTAGARARRRPARRARAAGATRRGGDQAGERARPRRRDELDVLGRQLADARDPRGRRAAGDDDAAQARPGGAGPRRAHGAVGVTGADAPGQRRRASRARSESPSGSTAIATRGPSTRTSSAWSRPASSEPIATDASTASAETSAPSAMSAQPDRAGQVGVDAADPGLGASGPR